MGEGLRTPHAMCLYTLLLSRKVKARFRGPNFAERVGFEPTVPFPGRRISSAVLSTTQPPLRG